MSSLSAEFISHAVCLYHVFTLRRKGMRRLSDRRGKELFDEAKCCWPVLFPSGLNLARREDEAALLDGAWAELDREGGNAVGAIGPVGCVACGRVQIGRLLWCVDGPVHTADQRLHLPGKPNHQFAIMAVRHWPVRVTPRI